jgi:CelD/BcsL family acetyltransferase involved in cellulose biosynthesis
VPTLSRHTIGAVFEIKKEIPDGIQVMGRSDMDAGTACATETFPVSLSTCYKVDPLSDPRWAALVEEHPRASLFHSPNWLRALRAVYGYEPVVVTTCPPDAHLTNGLVFCRINSWLTGRRLVSLPFSDHCDPLIDQSDELDEMLLHMRRDVDEEKCKYIEIRPVSYQPSGRTELSRGVTYLLHRLDLRPATEELFLNFHKDCVKRKIRRAEREKLQYEEGTSEELLQKFYRLLVMTRRRQYLPPQPLNWFRGLIAAFGNDIKIRVASKDRTAVASILTLPHKKSMIYKYGCSNAAFNRLGGTALLFWKTIQEARGHGFEELDMGRSDIDNLGLIAFKERWGATGTVICYWSYPPEPTGLPGVWKEKLVRRVVSISPDIALETVGKLLYKHIG